MTSIRRRIDAIIDIALRVPPVFVLDAVLKTFDYTEEFVGKYTAGNYTGNSEDDMEDVLFTLQLSKTSLLKSIAGLAGVFVSAVVFMLNTNKLIMFYVWLWSLLSILMSYAWNVKHIDHILISSQLSYSQQFSSSVYSLIVQLFLCAILYASNLRTNVLRNAKLLCILFTMPSLISIIPFIPAEILNVLPLLSTSFCLFHMIFGLLPVSRIVFNVLVDGVSWAKNIHRIYGLHMLLESEWNRVCLPQVLRVFWITRTAEQAVFMFANTGGSLDGLLGMTFDKVLEICKSLLVKGCDTIVSVSGLTSVLSSLCQGVGHLFHLFLKTEDREEERNMGTVSAILFMILALQTGLTGLTPEKRFIRLYRNLCLLLTAVLHFIHSMVNPLLMSLSTSNNLSLNRHLRVLSVCIFLIVFPCSVLTYLWCTHSVSTWLLAITAFSVEVVIKVVTSLMVYTLFMIDARQNSFWEELDDYVYYIRSMGNSIEFVFGIFLFFNGVWILLFESGGTIRACMMGIHAYCNIWLQAKAGWKVFIKRRTAVSKICSLPEATEEELKKRNDLCAICFQDLSVGCKITSCNHIYHSVCLRKWLYVQDNCPLCHQKLYSSEKSSDETEENDVPEEVERINQHHLHQE